MKRKIVLCADDYGLSPAVSRGIRELLRMGGLSATSCMVVYPEFADDGPQLGAFRERADLGLHFTLTHNRPLSSVLAAGWLRRLEAGRIRGELDRQLGIFTDIMRFPPSYIDGHQHVHLLPGVRKAVVDAAKKLGAYVRVTREPITGAMLKRPAPLDAAYLSWSSGPLARLAKQHGLRVNRGFRGVRSFKERAPFRDLFRDMTAGVSHGSIVMCHPGYVDDALQQRDPIHQQRQGELAYLASDEFPRDLDTAGLEITRLNEALETVPSAHFPFSAAVA